MVDFDDNKARVPLLRDSTSHTVKVHPGWLNILLLPSTTVEIGKSRLVTHPWTVPWSRNTDPAARRHSGILGSVMKDDPGRTATTARSSSRRTQKKPNSAQTHSSERSRLSSGPTQRKRYSNPRNPQRDCCSYARYKNWPEMTSFAFKAGSSEGDVRKGKRKGKSDRFLYRPNVFLVQNSKVYCTQYKR
jgi:hypothetical protein